MLLVFFFTLKIHDQTLRRRCSASCCLPRSAPTTTTRPLYDALHLLKCETWTALKNQCGMTSAGWSMISTGKKHDQPTTYHQQLSEMGGGYGGKSPKHDMTSQNSESKASSTGHSKPISHYFLPIGSKGSVSGVLSFSL